MSSPNPAARAAIHQVELASALLLLVAATGCSALGTLTIPSHSKSELKARPLAVEFSLMDSGKDLAVKPPGDERLVPTGLAAAIAPVVAGFALKQVIKGIEKESKRYSVTYSGRAFEKFEKTRYRLEVKRCAKTDRTCARPLLWFRAHVYLYPEDPVLRIVPQSVVVRGSTAKIPAPVWQAGLGPRLLTLLWPPYLLSSLIIQGWDWIDDDVDRLDMNVQLTLQAVSIGTNERGVAAEIATVDFPLRDVVFGKTKVRGALQHLDTGYLPVPIKTGSYFYGNATVTVQESNDLGDVIARAAEKTKEKEESFAQRLLEAIQSAAKEDSE